MLEITLTKNQVVQLGGRLDASQSDRARAVFDRVDTTHTVDFMNLEYISSAGLGVLLKTQKRLNNKGHELLLINLNKHIYEIFNYAGFDLIFKIKKASGE